MSSTQERSGRALTDCRVVFWFWFVLPNGISLYRSILSGVPMPPNPGAKVIVREILARHRSGGIAHHRIVASPSRAILRERTPAPSSPSNRDNSVKRANDRMERDLIVRVTGFGNAIRKSICLPWQTIFVCSRARRTDGRSGARRSGARYRRDGSRLAGGRGRRHGGRRHPATLTASPSHIPLPISPAAINLCDRIEPKTHTHANEVHFAGHDRCR